MGGRPGQGPSGAHLSQRVHPQVRGLGVSAPAAGASEMQSPLGSPQELSPRPPLVRLGCRCVPDGCSVCRICLLSTLLGWESPGHQARTALTSPLTLHLLCCPQRHEEPTWTPAGFSPRTSSCTAETTRQPSPHSWSVQEGRQLRVQGATRASGRAPSRAQGPQPGFPGRVWAPRRGPAGTGPGPTVCSRMRGSRACGPGETPTFPSTPALATSCKLCFCHWVRPRSCLNYLVI